jgi:hypothetical protein
MMVFSSEEVFICLRQGLGKGPLWDHPHLISRLADWKLSCSPLGLLFPISRPHSPFLGSKGLAASTQSQGHRQG